ncbi:sensor histidine kinase [Arenibaculum pallidiluteum]|uniref:sensor histidine kinase n=1 Tax=Arenibaculum pallidiluteum TaxID=2812559 RepID=UPI001A9631FA|nr:HAMP domain-containing sensor histidine kinase [Arenibaculum pallidiluteum]
MAVPELSRAALMQPRPGPVGAVKRLLPRTLFGRALLIIVTPVVLLQVVATWIFYDRHWDTMTHRLAHAVAGEVAMVVEQLDRDAGPEERRRTLEMAARHMDLIITFEPGGRLTEPWSPSGNTLEQTLSRAIDERVYLPHSIDTRVAHEWIEMRIEVPDGLLSVMSPERRLYSSTTYIFLLWMVGAAMVLFAIAIIFMRNQIRPIRRLAAAADSFGKGRDLSPSFRLEGAAEVRQAAAAFLMMRERLKRQISQRTEMLAGVSHDLRTPLTRMKLQLEMFGDEPEVEELKADVVEMQDMIDGYLAFARGEGTEAPVPVDLARLVQDVAAGARRDGASVEVETGGDLLVQLRPNAVKRCLANLVNNARRHAKHVRITAARAAGVVEVLVDDDGPGIPAAVRDEVFKPFFRLDGPKGRAGGGVGLGLTIARDVARSHGGDIHLQESPSGGLRAVLRLPV